ncbi:CRISPR-associated endonuclease Cas1 [Schaalia sp. Marseille-Q2122]|uniref:CRISPR-associated endonuclease Cas1 n=1 Tax=Schaalia sp. Marseille-Q2122 TaxID=2736604 RepID=UPI0020CA824F|nr:CRISPR-associated endonuclease Cas1 [Schaalia sp. Marseille-Q2122]
MSPLLAQLSTALLLEAFEGTLTSKVHPQAFTPREGSDPRQAIDELVDIHAASAGSSLLFTFAPPDWRALAPRLSDLLPLQDRCVHLDALIQNALPVHDVFPVRHAPTDNHALPAPTARAQTFDHLRTLIVDNLLAPMDHALTDLGLAYARFGATGAVCALREADLHAAKLVIEQHANLTSLPLLSCEITCFATEDADAFLRPDLSAFPSSPRLEEAGHADQVLYVGRDGARIRVASGRVIVASPTGTAEMSIPCRLVSRIVLSGNVGLSAGARSWALRSDVAVCFLTRRGGYLGQLAGKSGAAHAQRLLRQAALSAQEETRLPLARAIVRAKLRNQVYLVQRLARRSEEGDVRRTCQAIRSLSAECEYAETISELMGLEGAASEAYFEALPRFVPPEVAFHGRSRRPPRDLANAALSYGYAILLSECVGALMAAGLEPSLGILHASTDKRTSLALDLMEEFRPLLVDQTVMALLRSKRLRAEHANPADEGGVWLTAEGKKIVTDAYEQTLQRSVRGALPGFAGSWRRHIHHEAQLLARAMMEPDYRWVGVVWR